MPRITSALPLAVATSLALGVTATTGVSGAGAAPAPSASERRPGCTTMRSADGNEPPCNPALAQSPWAAAHRGSYAQASSPLPGPRPGQEVDVQSIRLAPHGTGVPIVHEFSEPYADGRRVVWGSVISTPENEGVFKVDERTGEVIDFYQEPTGRPSSSSSGAYSVLDRDGRLIVAHRQSLDVYADQVPGVRTSPIAKVRSLDLTGVMCRDDDRIVGITMLYDGMVAFATELGVVGVVPRQPRRMTPANLRTISQNGADCDDPAVERNDLEQISNSIAAASSSPAGIIDHHVLAWSGRDDTQAGAEPDDGGRKRRVHGREPQARRGNTPAEHNGRQTDRPRPVDRDDVVPADPFHLSFSHHRQSLIPDQGAPRGPEALEAEAGPDQPLYSPVILFHDVAANPDQE